MSRSGLSHAYPSQLSAFVLARLDEVGGKPAGLSLPEDARAFESVLSVAYQVSLLRDEDRPLTFRLALAPEAAFDPSAGPPKGVHALAFSASRPFAGSMVCIARHSRSAGTQCGGYLNRATSSTSARSRAA